jgi:CheY-like chemotaxis protein
MCKDQAIILLVDDDADDQELLTEEINKLEPSILVKQFYNGMQVMEYLFKMEKEPPCLIILDYNMPVVSGLEVLEKLANVPHLRNVPKIVWSTSSSLTYQHKCLQTGALKYIVKANDMHGLTKIASEMIAACCGVN